MRGLIIAMMAGVMFGAGLLISGMANPAKVQGFLDVFGQWDPTLAFVMGGAIIPMSVAWVIQKRMSKPISSANFNLPGTTKIDAKLIAGAILFGVGWGISGLCPGPAIANLALAIKPASIFVISMLAGMLIHRYMIEK